MHRAAENTAVSRTSPGSGIVLRVAGLFGTLLVLAITALLSAWLYGLPFFDLPGANQIHLADARQALELSADSRSTQIQTALRERRGNLRLLSENLVLRQALATPQTPAMAAAASRHFQSVMGAYPDVFESLALLSTGDGRVLAASDATLVGRPLADADLLGRLSTPGLIEHIETTAPTVAGEPSLIIARQVPERDAAGTPTGKLLGVLVASVSIQELLGNFDRVELRSLGNSGSVSLFDQQQRLLATFRLLAGTGERPPPPVSQGMDGSFVENAADGRSVLATYRFVRIAANEGWSLVVRRERDEILHEIEQRAWQLLLFGLLFTVCGLIVVALAARHVTRPIRELANVAQRLAEGELSARVTRAKPQHGDEVATLAAAFNTLAERVETWHATLASEVATRTRELIDQQLQLEELVERRTADLSAALAAATQADRAKDAFLANVSHELRTPLNAVIGLTELARQLSRDPRQQDYLDKIGRAGKSLAQLINDLLDLTKIVAGRLEFENTPFSLRGVFERCQSVLMHQAAEKGLTLVERIDPEVPDTLIGDPLRIEQILLNLLGNAIKFTSSGHIELRISVLNTETTRVRLAIDVEDTGLGLSEQDIAQLFQPFAQADASMTRKFGGSGLGLAICKRLAEKMDGDICASSRPGSGSTFRVTLWLGLGVPGTPGDQARPDTALLASALPTAYHGARVLVVDDHPINREIVEALLSAVGITPEMANNGQEAVDRLRMSGANAFDLVLMDIQMPVMDGYSATRELRSRAGFEALPIVAMTAHIMEHEKSLQRAAGMSDHIGKPFDHPTFYHMLAKWIPVHKQRQAATVIDALPPATGAQDMPAWPAPGTIDSAAGLARFAGNTARYRHWLSDFADQGRSEVSKIEQAMATGQREQARQLAHALVGRVGMLGITRAQAFARQVEAAASRDEAADAAIIGLAAAVDEASEQIRRAFGSGAADATPPAALASVRTKVLGGYPTPLPRDGGVGGEGTSMPSQRPPEQTNGSGQVLSQGFDELDELVCHDDPSPQPLPREGGGAITDARVSPSDKGLRPTLSFAPALATPLPAGPFPASILALLRRLETADGDSERAIHDCLAELGETAWAAPLHASLACVRSFDFDAARRLFPDHETTHNLDERS
ncbi:MAG: ATP-binding protein [Accumulibacter sp.]|jgi:signal transduction histidine kinase/CheY-like chemotaxis protein|uniref:hybrid sensor histidine kinase/response regulator n=1 Tax=Accumulibacter sp. TaxID=2053492 RepID=UPI002FC2CE15